MRIIFLIIFICSSPVWANCLCEKNDGMGKCVQGYCIHEGQTSDVLFYLHGGNGGLESWLDKGYFTSQIQDYWLNQGIPSPTVINITYGPGWLLTSKNSSPYSGLFEDFETRLRPKIESLLKVQPKRRLLLGESMGAFNALQLSLRTDNYSKAAILCGVVSEKASPFSSDSDLTEEIRKSSAFKYHGEVGLQQMLRRLKGALGLARQFYPTLIEWIGNDPLNWAERTTSRTDFYIASGFHDEFASYEGNAALAKTLTERNLKVDWRPQWGGHCAVDIPSVAKFLTD